MYQVESLPKCFCFSLSAAGLLSRSRLRGTPGARGYTTALKRASAEVRGVCSELSKSRILTKNHGEPFRPAKAKQEIENPTFFQAFFLLLCCWLLLLHHV